MIKVNLVKRNKAGMPENNWFCNICGGNDTNIIKFTTEDKIKINICTICLHFALALSRKAIMDAILK